MCLNLHLRKFVLPALAALAASCVSEKPVAVTPHPAWPLPPDEPRVIFVKTIGGPADIGQSPAFWHRLANWITGDTGASENLQKPFGLALDDAGNLCLTDTGAALVCYVDFAHKKWRRYNTAGNIAFRLPVAIAHKNGIFYVADSELGEVLAFHDNGQLAFALAAPLTRPVGLALAGDELFVADAAAHAIFVFDLAGKLRFQFGQRGARAGEFNFPTHISADGRGHLFVTDSMNSRVQVFDTAGKYLSEIGSGGDTSGHFGRPKGVAVDSFGHVYVADAVFDNLQIFNMAGRLLLSFGEGGTGSGQFGLPNGIAIGPTNQIYVADCYNRRVQVFQYVGQP